MVTGAKWGAEKRRKFDRENGPRLSLQRLTCFDPPTPPSALDMSSSLTGLIWLSGTQVTREKRTRKQKLNENRGNYSWQQAKA